MRVVNVRWDRCTHYIGQQNSYDPSEHGKFTNLENPFKLYGGVTRHSIVDAYERWARSQPLVLEKIKALPRDAVIGCWCKPLACHGDIILKLWRELNNEP